MKENFLLFSVNLAIPLKVPNIRKDNNGLCLKEQNYFYLMDILSGQCYSKNICFWIMQWFDVIHLEIFLVLFYWLFYWFRSPYRWKVYLILSVIGHFISSWQSVYQAAWILSVWRMQIFSKWVVQHCRTRCSNNFTIKLQTLFLVLQPCLPVVMTTKLLRRVPSQS